MDDYEKQSLLAGAAAEGEGGGGGVGSSSYTTEATERRFRGGAVPVQESVGSYIGPGELPPPYQQDLQSGGPVVTCRVCQAMIDISWKREQHVVKCLQCNEATVRKREREPFS